MKLELYRHKYIILAISIFTLFISLLYGDFILNINNKLLFNDGDPVLNLYFLKWGADYILGNVSGVSIFNLPVAFPFQNSLAFSDNLFGNQIIFLPYYVLTNNPLLAFNLWIFTTHFLNYILMYWYIKNSKFIDTTNNSIVPIIGASVFTFSIPCFDLLGGHLQLIPLYFIPLTLFLLEKVLTTLKIKYFILFGLALSFQFYLAIQTGFILLVILMFLMPVYYVYLLGNKILFFKRVWISALAFALPTITLLLPYLKTSKLTGHRTYNDVLNYIPSISNFFSTNIGEKAIFIGFPVLLLFILAIYFMQTNKSKILLGVVVLSFLFFLKETHIFEFFFTYIPGFDSIRTPGRFILVSITSITIFVTVVLSNIEIKKLIYIFILFILGMSISLYQKNIPSIKYKYFDNPISAKALQVINHKPTLILPLYKFRYPGTHFMIKRMKNVDMQFPILDIYSGFNPTFVAEIESEYLHRQNTFQANDSFFNRIKKLGFKHIILEKDKLIHKSIIRYLSKEIKFKKVYEDNLIILYSLIEHKQLSLSLNGTLKNTSWKLDVTTLKNKQTTTVFTGILNGKELSGVVQKKESIHTKVKVHNREYPCQLQLDKIKDSFSLFQCISKKNLDLPPIDYTLNMPKVNYETIEPYNYETDTLKLKITNTGSEIWNTRSRRKYNLALSYKLENELKNIKIGYNNRFYLPSNINAGESFEIEIPIKNLPSGENILTFSMAQELGSWVHNKADQTLSIKINKVDYILKMPKVNYEIIEPYNYETDTLKLQITNTGNEIWNAYPRRKYGLALSYMLENKEMGIKTEYNNRFHLPHNIKAGESFELEIPMKDLPSGENILTFSMLQELVFWFHDKGNETLSIKINRGDSIK